MINVTDLRSGVVFKDNGNYLQVLSYEHTKMGRGSGNIKVKVKNLRTLAVIEKSFITGARVEEVSIDKRLCQYLYADGENFHFMDKANFEQFELPKSLFRETAKFLKEGMDVDALLIEGETLGISLPIGLTYKVSDTGPEEKGNTVSNVFKDATLDNGMVVKVPMYMKVGEEIKVDTRTGEYVERVK